MTTIGFIGVGAMGGPMAANLVKAGFDVVVHDADATRARAVAASLGCACADGLAQVAARDVVITMLPDGKVVADVLLREADGAFLANARPGTVVVDMSSSEPPITQATGAALKERGVALVDAPVSGGVPRAHLVSWRSPDALLLEVFTNEGAGTLVVPELGALSLDERVPETAPVGLGSGDE